MKNANKQQNSGKTNGSKNNYRKNKKSNTNGNRNYGKSELREQPGKDSDSKRVNLDNERVGKFIKDMEKDHNNDVAWYAHNPEMLKAAGSYGFSYLTGQNLPFKGLPTNAQYGNTVPGVMSFNWIPAYGGQDIRALNQSANALYSFVVHANSRNKSYDATDLMITILATEQVFSMLAAMIRAYGVARNFSDRDVYTPDALLTAMGFRPNDIRANLATMWFDINEFVSRTVQLWIPKNLPFVARQFWMNTNIYRDSATSKAQYYLYVQNQYYMYDELRFETGGCLSPVTEDTGTASIFQPGTVTYSWEQWKIVFNKMITALLDSQDRGIMLGDVLKAYGRENLYTVNEVDVNYSVAYVYSQEVLTQFENMTVCPQMTRLMGIRQNIPSGSTAPYLESYYFASAADNMGSASNMGPSEHIVLNFHQNETPTAEQVMVATRMTAGPMTGTQVSCTQKQFPPAAGWSGAPDTVKPLWLMIPASVGTEVCVGVKVWFINPSGSIDDAGIPVNYTGHNDNIGNLNIGAIYMWSAFDWAPWLYVNYSSQTGAVVSAYTTQTQMALGDWDNYTILTANDLLKLHTAAVYSEFGVPVL